MHFDFAQILFLLASFIAAIGLIFIIYSRSSSAITSKLFILTLVLVIAYLISHTIHFVLMPQSDLTALDISCHSLLLMILVSLTFFSWNYPSHKEIGLIRGLLIIIPSIILLILLWNGDLIRESHGEREMFSVEFSPLYPFFQFWYLFLIVLNAHWIIKTLKNTVNELLRKQLLVYLSGLIVTNLATFIFGLFLPWILGIYYLVEISPLAFLLGFIFFTAIAIGKYNMFPSETFKLHSFSLNKKIVFSAIIVVPIIILLIQIPLGRILFNISSAPEMMRFFFISLFVGLIVSLSMSFIISRIIAHPISLLKEKAREIEKGNFSAKVENNSNDEVGELSVAFNSMASTLEKNQSELSAREERISVLLNAFEKSLAAIAIVDFNFNVIEANQQFYKIIGKTNHDNEPNSIDYLQFRHTPELFQNIIDQVNSNSVYTAEIEVGSDDLQSKKHILMSVTKIISREAVPKGYLFVEIDITEQKKLEEEIIRSEKFTALGKMSAVLSHEINTPLTSIKMNVDILNQTLSLKPEDKEAFQIISKEINRLTGLVKEVLQVSRTEQLKISNLNLKEFVKAIFYQAEINTTQKYIRFNNLTEEINFAGDENKLKQVFINLIQNSTDAIEKEGTIAVTSHLKGNYLFICFTDNGNGIQEHKNIFDPFYTTKTTGTGLGLSISQKIIEQHKGTFRLVSSRAGETIFEIKLPMDNNGNNFSN